MSVYHADFYVERGEGFSERDVLSTEKEKQKFSSDELAKEAFLVDVRELLKKWSIVRVVVYKNGKKIHTMGYTRMAMKDHMRHTKIQMTRLGFESMEFDGPWNEGFEERRNAKPS